MKTAMDDSERGRYLRTHAVGVGRSRDRVHFLSSIDEHGRHVLALLAMESDTVPEIPCLDSQRLLSGVLRENVVLTQPAEAKVRRAPKAGTRPYHAVFRGNSRSINWRLVDCREVCESFRVIVACCAMAQDLLCGQSSSAIHRMILDGDPCCFVRWSYPVRVLVMR